MLSTCLSPLLDKNQLDSKNTTNCNVTTIANHSEKFSKGWW